MKFSFRKNIGAFLVASAMVIGMFAGISAVAAGDHIEVILEDVTESDSTTLTGEAKIKVSIKGAAGTVDAAQVAFHFSGNLRYKTIKFLQNADVQAVTDPYPANAEHSLTAGIAMSTPITFTDEMAVFILTFEGTVGESVTVTVDNAHSYCLVGNSKIAASGDGSATAAAAANANEGMTATVKIQMDKVPGFVAGTDSSVTLRITDETTGNTIAALLNEDNRDSGSAATFTVNNTVVKGHRYTVFLFGIGYIPYEKTGVTFSNALTITNSDFIPGDINKDGRVDGNDKTAYDNLIKEDAFSAAADFNRDGYVDEKDNVFGAIEVTETAPAKMEKPTVTGGTKQITVTWTAPDDGGSPITGYILKYGTGNLSLNQTKEVSGASLSTTITNLYANKTYYVSIAAKNAIGIGAYSETGSGKTEGGGVVVIETDPGTIAPVTKEPFTDLFGYDWAKPSIYTLKDKGIINGVSETAYAPANPIKRGDFILILTRMLSINDAFSENFADVPQSAYYYNAIGNAKVAGIATGDGQNFMPENTITRQDLTTLAYRALLAKGYISETANMSPLNAFADKDNIATYALVPMAAMVDAGIIQGADGRVNPLGNATRAEVAVMCARLLALLG